MLICYKRLRKYKSKRREDLLHGVYLLDCQSLVAAIV